MAVFGPNLQFLKQRSATCESRSRPPPLSFLLKPCPNLIHTHRYHPAKFHPNPKHDDGSLIFAHFARAACLLLAATKAGRSTLDTKEGYKTKTGSTSSVTLTLTRATPSPNLNRNPQPPPQLWMDAPLTPGQTPRNPRPDPPPNPQQEPTPRPPAGTPPPDPRLDPPQPPPPPRPEF